VGRSEEELQEAARHVGLELVQLAAMPHALEAAERNGDRHMVNACIESISLHARNLIEFLIEPNWSADIHRTDFAPGWSPPNSPVKMRLLDARQAVDHHLSHLKWERVTHDSSDREPRPLASDVVEVMGSFVAHLEAEGHQAAEWFSGHLLEARLLLQETAADDEESYRSSDAHERAAPTDSSRGPTSAIPIERVFSLVGRLRSALGVTATFLTGVAERGLRGLFRRQDGA
jgi:hypothetical protein